MRLGIQDLVLKCLGFCEGLGIWGVGGGFRT